MEHLAIEINPFPQLIVGQIILNADRFAEHCPGRLHSWDDSLAFFLTPGLMRI